MPWTIAFVSQKGGCGKSTLARLFAQQFVAPGVRQAEASGDLTAVIADMDVQGTSAKWSARRKFEGFFPINVVPCRIVQEALEAGKEADALVIDGRPYADAQTTEIAASANLVVIPTGPALDDLEPGVLVAHGLVQSGVPKDRLRFALFRTDKDAPRETVQAVDYIMAAGYQVIDGALPDKPSYRRALDQGRSPSETINPITGQPYDSLNAEARQLADNLASAVLDT